MKVLKSRVVTVIGVEFWDFITLGDRGLRGVSFNSRSCKVARAESSCECVAHLSGRDQKGNTWCVLVHQGINP
jgi:hypothetical protein